MIACPTVSARGPSSKLRSTASCARGLRSPFASIQRANGSTAAETASFGSWRAAAATAASHAAKSELVSSVRGSRYWYEFEYAGVRHRRSSRTGSPRAAREMECAHRSALIRSAAGLPAAVPRATVAELAARFVAFLPSSGLRSGSQRFYAERVERLLEYGPLGRAQLASVDQRLADAMATWGHLRWGLTSRRMMITTLRRMLHLGVEWGLLPRAPRLHLEGAPAAHDYVLSAPDEALYLGAAGLPLRAAAVLGLDAGLRPGESVSLTRRDFRAGDPPHILLAVQPGRKGRRPRKVPLTARAAEAVGTLRGEPLLGFRLTTSLDHAHAALRRRLGLPREFTPHSFRHTCATRMGAAGVDPFTMCRFFGWASIEMATRYVHPSDASMRAALLALGPPKGPPSCDAAIAEWSVSHRH